MLTAELGSALHRLRSADDATATLELAAELAPEVTGVPTTRVLHASDRTGAGDAVHTAPVTLDATILAFVVLEGPAPTAAQRRACDDFAGVLAIALERAILRRRVGDLADELRRFAELARGIAGDLTDAATAIPTDHGLGSALPRSSTIASDNPRHQLLSAREKRVAALLVDGRSNREIAEALLVSPETVKTLVGRILRKLGAANRVEAVALLLGPPRPGA